MTAVVAAFAAGRPASAVKPLLAKASGEVLGVNAQNGTLLLGTQAKNLDLLINADTRYFLNNHTANAQAVVIGDQVDVIYDFQSFVVVELTIHRKYSVRGAIIAAAANNVTIRQRDGTSISSQVNIQTRLRIQNTRIDSATLLLGLDVRGELETNTNLALNLNASSFVAGGKLATVTPATGEFTTTGSGLTNFILHADGRVTLFGRSAVLADLRAGDRLKVFYAQTGSPTTALVVEASGGPKLRARGKITAVGGGTVTVNTSGGPLVLNLSSITIVKRNGRNVGAGRLRVGDKIKAKYVARGGLNTPLRITIRN